MRILLVEDEQPLAALLRERLRPAGFTVDICDSVAGGAAALTAVPYDALILDLGLPDRDGMELLAQVRRQGLALPVLILTARDGIGDRVAGLDNGADDYLVKPFAMVELIARLKALLRRPGQALGQRLECANLLFDTLTREASIEGLSLALARREVDLLELLLRRPGRVTPRGLLEEKLYGFGEEVESNSIPVHIHHLRRKLQEAGAAVEIHTVRGVGYLLRERSS